MAHRERAHLAGPEHQNRGLTQIALMSSPLPSVAIASVSPMTPYLETLYAASPGNFSVA
jgi:hypothetical protein